MLCPCGIHGAFAASEIGGGPTVDPGKGYWVQPIGDSLYWISDGAYNAMFLVTSAGVIACDAPPSFGANHLKAIAEITAKPITHLVYSHEHVDHIAGAHLFPQDVTIIGHRKTAELLASRRDFRRPVPSVTFDGIYPLEHGGQRLDLAYRGVNHSIDNIFIFAPRQKALMAIDIIYPGWMPYKNLGVAVDIPGFVAAHRDILSYDFETLVAGHVSRPGTRADVLTQIELVNDLPVPPSELTRRFRFQLLSESNPAGAKGRPGICIRTTNSFSSPECTTNCCRSGAMFLPERRPICGIIAGPCSRALWFRASRNF